MFGMRQAQLITECNELVTNPGSHYIVSAIFIMITSFPHGYKIVIILPDVT